MKTAVVFGAGADVGSNILLLNAPEKDGFVVTDVVTRPPRRGSEAECLTDIEARLRLTGTDPGGAIRTGSEPARLLVNGREIRVHFMDIADSAVGRIGRFDLGIVATARAHVRDRQLTARLQDVADYVLGAAEAMDLPAIYAPLTGADLSSVLAPWQHELAPPGPGTFALGSCQCVGWAAQLRGILEMFALDPRTSRELIAAQVDIVHPDTASSMMGTSGIGSRREDPRDNMRPGFSQLQDSLQRFNIKRRRNAVSLRVLTQPPGFQLSRFVIKGEISMQQLRTGFQLAEAASPDVIQLTDSPLGSRAYASTNVSATVIMTDGHLVCEVFDDYSGTTLTEITTQAWVHNTRGYAQAVLKIGSDIFERPESVRVIPPNPETIERGAFNNEFHT